MHQLTVVAAGIIHTDPLIISMMHGVKLLIYTMSQKKRPTFTTCYNFYIHSSIATIFGTNVAKKVGNQNVLYFPPHLASASALPGETGVFFT